MAAIQISRHPTRDAIYAFYERTKNDAPRRHLGASLIGRDCERQLWYSFRWALTKRFDGRMLRLFEVGHLAEARFTAGLRGAGITVHDVDPAGKQWKVWVLGGHAGGSMDAAGENIPEAPKTWHVIEYKTHSDASFAKLVKDGVEKAKPEHVAQMQVYMGETGMTRALYVAENKNTSELHVERIDYDAKHHAALKTKFQRIVDAKQPLERCSSDPSFWKCKQCDFHSICHEDALPEVNCRTCAHSTPEMDGHQRWSCARHKMDIPGDSAADKADGPDRTGCGNHRYIPIFLEKHAKQVDFKEETGNVVYELRGGGTFENGDAATAGGWSSQDIRNASDKRLLADPVAQEMRQQFATATVVA